MLRGDRVRCWGDAQWRGTDCATRERAVETHGARSSPAAGHRRHLALSTALLSSGSFLAHAPEAEHLSGAPLGAREQPPNPWASICHCRTLGRREGRCSADLLSRCEERSPIFQPSVLTFVCQSSCTVAVELESYGQEGHKSQRAVGVGRPLGITGTFEVFQRLWQGTLKRTLVCSGGFHGEI